MACGIQKLIVLGGFGGHLAARKLIQWVSCGAHERQLIHSAAMIWRPMYCAHPLQTMQVQSIVTFNTVQGPDPRNAKADLS
jgi:hypothetical protein